MFPVDLCRLIAVLCMVIQTVQNELARMEKRCKEQENHQRLLYKKMLGTTNDETSDGAHEVRLCASQLCCFHSEFGNCTYCTFVLLVMQHLKLAETCLL